MEGGLKTPSETKRKIAGPSRDRVLRLFKESGIVLKSHSR
jgi:hypothetical protein